MREHLITELKEADTQQIIKYIEEKVKLNEEFQNTNLFFASNHLPILNSKEIIRHRLYNYHDEYVAEISNGEIKSLISASIRGDKSAVLDINFIYSDSQESLKNMLNYLCDVVAKKSISTIYKVKIILNKGRNLEDWKSKLILIGFNEEDISENFNEIGLVRFVY